MFTYYQLKTQILQKHFEGMIIIYLCLSIEKKNSKTVKLSSFTQNNLMTIFFNGQGKNYITLKNCTRYYFVSKSHIS